ncbi:MAG: hypothetical protein ACRBF0_05250 [Calditrichia bacterium]
MKRIILSLIFGLTALSTSLSAQTEFYARAGTSIPFTPDQFSTVWKSNLNYAFGFRLARSKTALIGLEFSHHDFLFDEIAAVESGMSPIQVENLSGKLSSVNTLNLHLKWWPILSESKIRPALIAGAGFSQVKSLSTTSGFADEKLQSGRAGSDINGLRKDEIAVSFNIGGELLFRLMPNFGLVLSGAFTGMPGEESISGFTSFSLGISLGLPK